MYNYYQQQPTQATPIRPIFPLKGHPVSSFEEAKASSIDFDGTIFFFPDVANKKIYTKQINSEGVAVLNLYELKPLPIEPTSNDFITRAEFEQTLNNLIQKLTPSKQPSEQSNYKEVF